MAREQIGTGKKDGGCGPSGTAFQAVDSSRRSGHGQDARATREDHGQDARATREDHGQDARATKTHATRNEGKPEFIPFARENVGIRQGAYLPHWTQDGAIYAATFRLADSLPKSVLEGWLRERDEIVGRAASAGRDLTADERQRLDKLHSETVEQYLDAGHGACYLANPGVAEIVRDALLHFEGRRYVLGAWCVMPNHVHAVVCPLAGHALERILHSWKSYSSNQANALLARKGAFWQPESFDHLIRDEEDYAHRIAYVLDNPRQAGLKDWAWVGCGTAFQAVDSSLGSCHRQEARGT